MFRSLKRGMYRMLTLLLIGMGFIYFAETDPRLFGELGAPMLRGFGLCFIGLAAGDFALRIMQPHVDTEKLTRLAETGNIAAGISYLGRCILYAIILFLVVVQAHASEMPPNAIKYSPILIEQAKTYYPEMTEISILAAQVEQETCRSLKSPTCWSPLAQLKTSREQGVGFSQATRTFYASGRIRFDVLQEMVDKYPKELKGYSWNNWQDPVMQARLLVLKDRDTCNRIKNAATKMDQYQLCMSAYNGGSTGLSNDRLSCRAKPGCNPNVWFGNVETAGIKSKVEIPGYGRSANSINRTYVSNIFGPRRPKYLKFDVI